MIQKAGTLFDVILTKVITVVTSFCAGYLCSFYDSVPMKIFMVVFLAASLLNTMMLGRSLWSIHKVTKQLGNGLKMRDVLTRVNLYLHATDILTLMKDPREEDKDLNGD